MAVSPHDRGHATSAGMPRIQVFVRLLGQDQFALARGLQPVNGTIVGNGQ